MRQCAIAPLVLVCALTLPAIAPAQVTKPNRVTILYDAFSRRPDLDMDWGYAALVEFNGKRILFDTGSNAGRLEHNVKKLGVDLTRLDMVVISHRDGDHTSGLKYVLSVNPNVPVYAPVDDIFGIEIGKMISSHPDAALPADMRYYGGHVPAHVEDGTAWPGKELIPVRGTMTVAPGVRLITNTSERSGTRDMHEVSLLLDTPTGSVLVVGCSHPGILNILADATQDGTHVRELFGGIHEFRADRAEVEAMVKGIADQYKVDVVALGHCTGEVAFALLKERMGKDDVYAGLGETIAF